MNFQTTSLFDTQKHNKTQSTNYKCISRVLKGSLTEENTVARNKYENIVVIFTPPNRPNSNTLHTHQNEPWVYARAYPTTNPCSV